MVLTNIHKSYKTDVVLRDVDLKIETGEFVVLMGPSGSGKSTLLNILGGLDKPSAGVVLVDGADITKLSDRKLSEFRNQTIGFVFQFFYLQPFLSVAENIALPLIPAKVPKKTRVKMAEEVAEKVGLKEKLRSLPKQLSGGEIQRVAIARAITNRPKIIIADEPTGNLDHANSLNVIKLFRQICKQSGSTLIVATHDEEIANVADRTLKLKDGRLI
ncbi:MAG: ABC transporter ATP-binding protein [Candidatus Nomurabacteria bacterium]|nr:ABC transporter ATP-binding protein [Candidatus Nomurabacteria bacterium]